MVEPLTVATAEIVGKPGAPLDGFGDGEPVPPRSIPSRLFE